MQDEIWKDVVGYEQFYQVSDKGRIRYKKNGEIARQTIFPNGYRGLRICAAARKATGAKNGRTELVHRLVANAFIPNPHEYAYINHKDCTRDNNCVENLEWCTQQYNCNYANRNALVSASRSDAIFQLDLSGNIVKKWEPNADAGRIRDRLADNGYVYGTVKSCCLGDCKTYKGYRWCFEKDYDSISREKTYIGKLIPIVQLTMDGRLIKKWSSTTEATKDGHLKVSIIRCLKGKNKQHHGYRWQYLEDYEREHGIKSAWKEANTVKRKKYTNKKSKKENA